MSDSLASKAADAITVQRTDAPDEALARTRCFYGAHMTYLVLDEKESGAGVAQSFAAFGADAWGAFDALRREYPDSEVVACEVCFDPRHYRMETYEGAAGTIVRVIPKEKP